MVFSFWSKQVQKLNRGCAKKSEQLDYNSRKYFYFRFLVFVFVFGICIWPNGHAHWIFGKILSGQMIRLFVVRPELSCLGFVFAFVFVFGICIWPNGHAHWISCQIFIRKMVIHFVVQPKLSILGFCICIWICIWPNGHAH